MPATPPVMSGAFPLIGHIPSFVKDRQALLQRGFQEKGPVFSIRLPKPVAVVAGSELNRWFYSETDKSLNMSKPYEFLKEALGEVLFTASKELYEEQRPLLKTIFSNERMLGYVTAMNIEVDRWLERLGNAGEIDISDEMLTLTQFVAGHAFLGPRFHEELGPDFWPSYLDIAKSLDPVLPPRWPLPKFRRRDKAKARIREILGPICQKRRENPGAHDDVISILVNTPLPSGQVLDQQAVVALWTGLMFAGHETTAGQAAWSIILTLQHPEIAARLRAEAEPVVSAGQLGPKELRQLELTYGIIDETTRMRPSADIQIRVADQDVEIGGYVIPAGWGVMVGGPISHNLPVQFPRPEFFEPERFMKARDEGKDAYAIVGFGGGRHKCTGMNFAKNEMAIILSKLFTRFDLELVTMDTRVVSSVGANRPSATKIRYKRRT